MVLGQSDNKGMVVLFMCQQRQAERVPAAVQEVTGEETAKRNTTVTYGVCGLSVCI